MLWPSLAIAGFISHFHLFPTPVSAYVPAIPANSTSGSGPSAFDVHDNSTVSLKLNPSGTYSTDVSYQQYGLDSEGISKGALVRVSEDDLTGKNATLDRTSAPWIALINCDRNSTNNDLEEDIFSKVSDRGAVAALLYSNTSDGCLMNPEYLFTYNHLFDIFTSKTPIAAILIQSQFNNINHTFSTFDPVLLNQSETAIRDALPKSAENKSPYIVATLRAANATGVESDDDPAAVPTTVHPSEPTSSSSRGSGPSQSLAMIILYVIVSLVAALFIVVILSGAIRAFRHPERYGPRLYDPGLDGEDGQGRTRAGGITQAILDTFPVVKFGRGNGGQANDLPYAHNQRLELKQWNTGGHHTTDSTAEFAPPNDRRRSNAGNQVNMPNQESRKSLLAPTDSTPSPHRVSAEEEHANPLDPAAIGRETCPICIVDFEEGDDLRVLPCEGKHRFHKDCVDPWLLELSTSCPICREDFQALEDMAAAGVDDINADGEEDHDQFPPPDHQDHHSTTTPSSRFSKYIRFAQKRRRRSLRDQARSSTPAT